MQEAKDKTQRAVEMLDRAYQMTNSAKHAAIDAGLTEAQAQQIADQIYAAIEQMIKLLEE